MHCLPLLISKWTLVITILLHITLVKSLQIKPTTAPANLHKLDRIFPHCQWYRCYQPVASLVITATYLYFILSSI